MPITAFSSFNDGLDPNQRSREHFITNINLEDDRLWVPYADGVWFQPYSFNVTSGGFSVVLKGLPGSMVGTHYHVGTVTATRCAATGVTWNMIGLQNPAPIFTSPLAKRTPWSSLMIRRSR